MLNLTAYGFAQFAVGNDAKANAFAALALDMVASVKGWNAEEKRKTKAECESALSIALTLAKVPETSARRYLATVSGLAMRLSADFAAELARIQSASVNSEDFAAFAASVLGLKAEAAAALSITEDFARVAVVHIRFLLWSEGIENLSFLETYARKGKPGVAALAAEFAAKAEARAKAESMTEAEAAEAAKAEAEAAEAAKAEASPRAKAAKQAAAILASLAKHSDNMTDAELSAIASALAEVLAKRHALAAAVKIEQGKAEALAAA